MKKAIHDGFAVNKSKYYIKKPTYLRTHLYQKGIFISMSCMWQDCIECGNNSYSEAVHKSFLYIHVYGLKSGWTNINTKFKGNWTDSISKVFWILGQLWFAVASKTLSCLETRNMGKGWIPVLHVTCIVCFDLLSNYFHL